MNDKELKQYISVSDYAKYIGRTSAHVYNLIKEGIVSAVTFQRGTMIGRLVEKPADYDEWKTKNAKCNGHKKKSKKEL